MARFSKFTYKQFTILIIVALGSSCSKVQFEDTGTSQSSSLATAQTPPVTIVKAACSNSSQQKRKVDFFFPKPNKTCDWSVNGNLLAKNNYFQGRIEQEQILDLGPGTIICDVKFNFAEQTFLYDDHVLMTFNNAIIASSYNFTSQLPSQNGLLRYDWALMAGMYWDHSKEGVFCPNQGQCSWPATDTPGKILMNYPAQLFQGLMAEDINRNQHSIKFVSIGDNDNLDCEHSDLNFSIDVSYVKQ